MEIKINRSDFRKVNKLFDNLQSVSEKEANLIIDKNEDLFQLIQVI